MPSKWLATSAGFLLSPRGLASLGGAGAGAESIWSTLLARYPTLARIFADALPLMPIVMQPKIQHRLERAAGERWALMPHTFAFVDPLFSTGIAWGLRAVERLALAFEDAVDGDRLPDAATLARYDTALAAEADQIDLMVAGAYEAMAHFDLFAAQAMLYFATVSFAEVRQRLRPDDSVAHSAGSGQAWNGFMGVGDAVLHPVARESLVRLRSITKGQGGIGSADERAGFAGWLTDAIASRNVVGLADPARRNLYPVDLDTLIDRHALLGLGRQDMLDGLPKLRGMGPEPKFGETTAYQRLPFSVQG